MLTAQDLINTYKQDSVKIVEEIQKAKTAVVMAHLNPDGDTLGSMLAIAKVLEQAGVERVDRIMHDEVPEIYTFYPDQEKVMCSMKEEDKAKTLDEYDISFSLDCGSVKRLGSAGNIWLKAKTKINLDHHLSNPLYGDLNMVDPNATCTGQVVKELAKMLIEKGKKIETDAELASLYYITLLTDTGGFRHSNTNEDVFSWARELVSLGASPNILYNKLFNQMPFRAVKIIGQALAKLELIKLSNIAIAFTLTTREELDSLGAKDEDTDEIVDHIMRIKDLDMCIYLREGDSAGEFKGSLRSANPDIDCSSIATELNGGGHARAAGFNTSAASVAELKNLILEKIEQAKKITA